MNKLKGKRRKDANGRYYLATPYGRIYEGISKRDLIDGGYHTHGVNRRD